jgi:hypothetical protein
MKLTEQDVPIIIARARKIDPKFGLFFSHMPEDFGILIAVTADYIESKERQELLNVAHP